MDVHFATPKNLAKSRGVCVSLSPQRRRRSVFGLRQEILLGNIQEAARSSVAWNCNSPLQNVKTRHLAGSPVSWQRRSRAPTVVTAAFQCSQVPYILSRKA